MALSAMVLLYRVERTKEVIGIAALVTEYSLCSRDILHTVC